MDGNGRSQEAASDTGATVAKGERRRRAGRGRRRRESGRAARMLLEGRLWYGRWECGQRGERRNADVRR
uniref:Uncharacterized protein n=1 Tax=Hyaloperonospora arabidopsidis (strain Emoy2) TaxID=559515 RepID=M4BUX4_HYAAE